MSFYLENWRKKNFIPVYPVHCVQQYDVTMNLNNWNWHELNNFDGSLPLAIPTISFQFKKNFHMKFDSKNST